MSHIIALKIDIFFHIIIKNRQSLSFARKKLKSNIISQFLKQQRLPFTLNQQQNFNAHLHRLFIKINKNLVLCCYSHKLFLTKKINCYIITYVFM